MGTSADRPVTQGGDRRLWDELEATYDLFQRLGQPRPENFSITLASDGHQAVDLPGAARSWSLPL
jgi:hypothetical protein